MLDLGVDELLELGESDDGVEVARDLGALHPEDRPAQEDILPTRELGVKPRAHLEKRRHPPPQIDLAPRRNRDARQDLQEGALAGAVPADDANDLAFRDLERHVVESPDELVGGFSRARTSQPSRRRHQGLP